MPTQMFPDRTKIFPLCAADQRLIDATICALISFNLSSSLANFMAFQVIG